MTPPAAHPPAGLAPAPPDSPPAGPDASTLDGGDWPIRDRHPAGGQRREGFHVVVRQDVLDAMHVHGQSNTKVEVCGVMIGSTHRDAWGPYLLIHACIPAAEAHSHSANVTFTARAWAQIHAEMDRRFPDDRIVGWYHTHPGFGIFLSEMDLFIQGNFFNLPWQVAFVYDPVGGDEGMFVWRRGVPTREAILTEPAPADATPISLPPAPRESTGGGRAFMVLATILIGLVVALLAVTEVRGTGWVLDLIGRFTRP